MIDTKTIADPSVPGLSYEVGVEYDDMGPEILDDFDCYTPAQVRAWKRDEWSFVGVIVTPVIAGVPLSDCEASLWGIEYGQFTCTDEDDEIKSVITLDPLTAPKPGMAAESDPAWPGVSYPVPDLISEARSLAAGRLGEMITGMQSALGALVLADPGLAAEGC